MTRGIVALAVLVVGGIAALSAAAPAAGVGQCTGEVSVVWDGVELDLDDPDPARSGWSVDHLRTVSEGTGCAGVAQTLVLRGPERGVLFQGTVVLDDQGNGTYTGVDARVEDITEVQVLLRRDGSEPDQAGIGTPGPGPEGPTGPLARTGLELAVVIVVAILLVVGGWVVRAKVGRP